MMFNTLKAKLARAHKSLTIWFNATSAVVIAAIPYAHDNISELQGYVNERLYHYVAGAVVVANLIIRFKTSKDLAAK